jgi:signal transduction histidine kinase/CheY-like chemotaxis protein
MKVLIGYDDSLSAPSALEDLTLTGARIATTERERLLAGVREARRQAEEALRFRDDFMATLSHELRTPLTSILGWSRLLRTQKFSEEEMTNALEVIERNARAQVQLIEDLLDVSRIMTGKLRLDLRPIDPAAVVVAAADTMRPAAEAKGIALEAVLDAGAGRVSGDPDRLQQVVWNLVSNAVKFTPKGGRVEVRVGRVDSSIEILVSDTGAGIAPDLLPHVFDRFHQADKSSGRRHAGLGLGLSIVKHLVELHGGRVFAESPGEGRGAIFRVRLPVLAISSRAPEGGGRAAAEAGGARGRPEELSGLRVLFVDDDRDTREVVSAILSSRGAEVVASETAAGALISLRRLRPDVLVTDIGMPEEDGYWLIRRVRALAQDEGGGTPAAALTASARADDRDRALSCGFQIHLPKPVDPDELSSAVAALAGRTTGAS